MESVPPHVVRLMSAQDIEQALTIWAETGMFQAVDSLNTWMKIDPNGMFVAATDEGRILGTCCAILSKKDLAFFGFYAVRPEYRGKGVGGKIMQAALGRFKGQNCGLNTAESHLLTYRDRAGFRLQTGWISLACQVSGDNIMETCKTLLQNDLVRIVPIDSSLIPEVVLYDEAVHGENRNAVVTLSIQEPHGTSRVAIGQDGKVKGYGLIRKDTLGLGMIGPLYADDQATAENLTSELIKSFHLVEKYGLIFMGLRNNPGSVVIIEKLKMAIDDACERLFTKEIVTIPDTNRVFAQHDLNFINF